MFQDHVNLGETSRGSKGESRELRKGRFHDTGEMEPMGPLRDPRCKLGMVTQESQESLEFKPGLGFTLRISLKKEPSEMASLAAKHGDQHRGRRDLPFTLCPLPSTGALWHSPSPTNFKDFLREGR